MTLEWFLNLPEAPEDIEKVEIGKLYAMKTFNDIYPDFDVIDMTPIGQYNRIEKDIPIALFYGKVYTDNEGDGFFRWWESKITILLRNQNENNF